MRDIEARTFVLSRREQRESERENQKGKLLGLFGSEI